MADLSDVFSDLVDAHLCEMGLMQSLLRPPSPVGRSFQELAQALLESPPPTPPPTLVPSHIASSCWGSYLKVGVCAPSQGPCKRGFMPVGTHLKNKFCENCRSAGFDVPIAHVRVLTPLLEKTFVNQSRGGVWSHAKIGADQVQVTYRLANNTQKCIGPKFAIFLEPPPALGWAPLPPEWISDDGQHIRVVVAKGSLVCGSVLTKPAGLELKERGGLAPSELGKPESAPVAEGSGTMWPMPVVLATQPGSASSRERATCLEVLRLDDDDLQSVPAYNPPPGGHLLAPWRLTMQTPSSRIYIPPMRKREREGNDSESSSGEETCSNGGSFNKGSFNKGSSNKGSFNGSFNERTATPTCILSTPSLAGLGVPTTASSSVLATALAGFAPPGVAL